MTTFVVIPYLLGIIVPANHSIDEGLLEYTFQVDLRWKFSDFKRSTENIYLSVDLTCHEGLNNMMCRFEKYKVRQRAQEVKSFLLSDRVYVERAADQEAFESDSRPFQIMFHPKGIDGYIVESNTMSTRMLNFYRIIGNQLNVGVDVKGKERFAALERSNVGLCVTNYTIIKQKPPFIGPVANLTSFVDFDLANNKVIILKQRETWKCPMQTTYSVTASFWPDFFPETTTSHILIKSVSAITMSSRSFETLTENRFNLYDENYKIIGDISEKVELYLKSYRLLRPQNLITLDQTKIIVLDVIDDQMT